jgi:metal-responsive CopG/Arc/MetJ family transcriptional regulator
MKTAISIPDDLFDSAESTARRLGVSRSELYTRALRDYLAEHGAEGITERLNEVYGDGQESGLDPALAELQRRSLERGDERGEGW